MSELFSSATKTVLMMVTTVLSVITLYAVILGVWRGVLDPKDVLAIFASVMSFIIGFYFSRRSDVPTPEGTITSQETTNKVTTVKPESPVTTE